MNVFSLFVAVWGSPDRQVLAARARFGKAGERDVLQASILLAAAEAPTNSAIVDELAISVNTVCKWRHPFHAEGVPGLRDRARSGRPRLFSPTQLTQVKALAWTTPEPSGLPLSCWSVNELGARRQREGARAGLSSRTHVAGTLASFAAYDAHRAPRDFRDLRDLATRVLACHGRHSTAASPFDWTCIRAALNAFLKRLDPHEATVNPRVAQP